MKIELQTFQDVWTKYFWENFILKILLTSLRIINKMNKYLPYLFPALLRIFMKFHHYNYNIGKY